MGTTITAAHVGEHDVAIAHVGDSRAYRLRGEEFTRLTEDHSLVEEMRRRGQLTAQEADEHPQRSIITRALGPEPDVVVDTRSWRGAAGDVFLLCSDGLTSMIPEPQVADILRGAGSLSEAGHALIDAANEAGGRDNITVSCSASRRSAARRTRRSSSRPRRAASRRGERPPTCAPRWPTRRRPPRRPPRRRPRRPPRRAAAAAAAGPRRRAAAA